MAERNAMRAVQFGVYRGRRERRNRHTPHKSQLALHLEAITNAVRDAGLKITDVDGILRPVSILRPCLVRRWGSRRVMSMARAWAGAPS